MERLVVGYIRGTHGLAGTLKAASASGKFEHLLAMKDVALRKGGAERAYGVESCSESGGILFLKLAGVDSLEEAKSLRGSEMLLPREEAARLEENEWYAGDLVGCSLVYGAADSSAPAMTAGIVTDVLEGGGGDLLEVSVSEGCGLGGPRKVLVPFNEEFIGTVDTASKEIRLMHLWILE